MELDRFVVDFVASTLLKTKPVRNMSHKTFVQANNTNVSMHAHIYTHMHKHSGTYGSSKYSSDSNYRFRNNITFL